MENENYEELNIKAEADYVLPNPRRSYSMKMYINDGLKCYPVQEKIEDIEKRIAVLEAQAELIREDFADHLNEVGDIA